MSDPRGQKFLYGPVPSRRLGRSLGVDPLLFKTCSFDCIYCQLGPTTNKTLQRSQYVNPEAVIAEFEAWLDRDGDSDYITFSGSGEPTLHSDLGDMIRAVKGRTSIPVAVLTNGSLLWDAQVRRELRAADLVLPSLDAATEQGFHRINRPCSGLELRLIVDGIRQFTAEFQGEVWLEVMLVEGINDTERELTALRYAIDMIRPAQTQINTLTRPTPSPQVRALAADRLKAAAAALGPSAEIIAPLEARAGDAHEATEEAVMNLLRRRPCTLNDIASGLGIHPNEAIRHIQELYDEGKIEVRKQDGEVYLIPLAPPHASG